MLGCRWFFATLEPRSLQLRFNLFKNHLFPRPARQRCRLSTELIKSSLQAGSFRNIIAPTLVAVIPVSCSSLTLPHNTPQQRQLLTTITAEFRNKCLIPNFSVLNLEYPHIKPSRTNKPKTCLIKLMLNRVRALTTNEVL